MTAHDAQDTTMMPPSEPGLKTLHVQGHRVALMDEGHGPVFLAVHGLPGDRRDTRHLAERLVQRGCRVIRLELPGFGASSFGPDRPMSLRERGLIVAQCADLLELERVIWLGHSMGGGLVAEAARLRPAQTQALCLLASLGPRPHFHAPSLAALGALMRVRALRPALIALLRPVLTRQGFAAKRLSDQAITRTMLDVAQIDFERHVDNLRAVRAPTLVAWAEDDALVPPDISRELAALAAPGPRCAFAQGGHNLQKTQAQALTELLLRLAFDGSPPPEAAQPQAEGSPRALV